jgi:anti-anti-sigma factor
MVEAVAYRVARLGEAVYIQPQGLANMRNAPALDGFLQQTLAQSLRRCCVDLSVCRGMDSTFMGMMVGWSQRMDEVGAQLVIINPSHANRKLLDMLGVTHVVRIVEACVVPADAAFVDLPGGSGLAPKHLAELMRDAHLRLSAISDENRVKFQGFLAALDKDLGRH